MMRKTTVWLVAVALGFLFAVWADAGEQDALLREAARQGIVISDDALLAHFNEGRSSEMTMTEFTNMFFVLGQEGAALRDAIKETVLVEEMRRRVRCAIAGRIPRITPDEIAREVAAVTNHNAEVERANRSICRLATNSWKSIRAGNDFATVGRKLKDLCPSVSYEETCAEANAVYTNLTDGDVSAPLLKDEVLSYCRVSQPTGGVRRVSRIAFCLQKPREVLTHEQIEALLVEQAITAAYNAWLENPQPGE